MSEQTNDWGSDPADIGEDGYTFTFSKINDSLIEAACNEADRRYYSFDGGVSWYDEDGLNRDDCSSEGGPSEVVIRSHYIAHQKKAQKEWAALMESMRSWPLARPGSWGLYNNETA